MPVKRAEAAYAPRANPVDPAALKKEGNDHFKRGNHEAAAKCYTMAIDLWMEPKDRAVLYVNRATARLKQAPEPGCSTHALAESALRDAERSTELDATYPKAHFRQGQALAALQRHGQALAALRTVLKLSPGDSAAQALLQQQEASVAKDASAQPAIQQPVKLQPEAAEAPTPAPAPASEAAERVACLLASLQRALELREHDVETLHACTSLLEECEARLLPSEEPVACNG